MAIENLNGLQHSLGVGNLFGPRVDVRFSKILVLKQYDFNNLSRLHD